jgi:hypothetical protein
LTGEWKSPADWKGGLSAVVYVAERLEWSGGGMEEGRLTNRLLSECDLLWLL